MVGVGEFFFYPACQQQAVIALSVVDQYKIDGGIDQALVAHDGQRGLLIGGGEDTHPPGRALFIDHLAKGAVAVHHQKAFIVQQVGCFGAWQLIADHSQLQCHTQGVYVATGAATQANLPAHEADETSDNGKSRAHCAVFFINLGALKRLPFIAGEIAATVGHFHLKVAGARGGRANF